MSDDDDDQKKPESNAAMSYMAGRYGGALGPLAADDLVAYGVGYMHAEQDRAEEEARRKAYNQSPHQISEGEKDLRTLAFPFFSGAVSTYAFNALFNFSAAARECSDVMLVRNAAIAFGTVTSGLIFVWTATGEFPTLSVIKKNPGVFALGMLVGFVGSQLGNIGAESSYDNAIRTGHTCHPVDGHNFYDINNCKPCSPTFDIRALRPQP